MFDDIGGKIKGLAKVITVLGIILSCIYGFLMIPTLGLIVGLIYAAVGSLASWIGSFVLYGFGQLIENTDTMVSSMRSASFGSKGSHNSNIRTYEELHKSENKSVVFESKNPSIHRSCPECGFVQKGDVDYCGKCGAKFIYRKMS